MDWLKTLLPGLGTALGGPIGGIAASFIADKLGVQEKTVKAVTEALSTGSLTPDQLSQLKLAEIEFQKYLKDNNIKLEEIAAADRKSAREMMMSTRAKTPAVLTWTIVVLVMALHGYIIVNGTPPNVGEFVLGRIMGTLDTSLGLVLAFWFGTTHGSQSKNDLLANSKPV